MSVEVVWEEPPVGPARSGGRFSLAFAKELRANPGRWAKWPTPYTSPGSAAQLAGRIKSGIGAAWEPKGTFEACVRTADGASFVFARFVAEVES